MTRAGVADAAHHIANVMGRYVGAGSSPSMADDVLSLFDLEGEPLLVIANGPRLTGAEAVTGYWRMLEGLRAKNGGVLGAHLLTSPVIDVADDLSTATGVWMDLGTTLFGPGMGSEPREDGGAYTAKREVARYDVEFVLREGGWKINSLAWKILWTWDGEGIDERTLFRA